MIVNQLRGDLQSTNIMEVCGSLIAITKLAREDVIPVVIELVVKLLKHTNELVRKKAVSALHRLFQIQPECLDDYDSDITNLLTDKDPSVMGASLELMYDMCCKRADLHKNLAKPLTEILSQIIEGRLGPNYNFHGVPAPWMQIKIFRILSVLGTADQKTSAIIYPSIAQVMERPMTSEPINAAILDECARTVTCIYPNNVLLEKAASLIGYFVNCQDNNMIYLGIQGLYDIVKDYPQFTVKHQMKVLECLDSNDDTLRSKAVDLLERMCNPQNVQVIVEKIINYLKKTNDEFVRERTASKIYSLCERYTPSPYWFLKTMVVTLDLVRSNVKPEIITGIVSLLKDGTGDAASDKQFRNGGVELFVHLLDNMYLPESIVLLQSWVIGEYATNECSVSLSDICTKLIYQAQRAQKNETISSIMLTLSKLVARIKTIPEEVKDFFSKYYQSDDVLLQQQAIEFVQFCHNLPFMTKLLGFGACSEDVKVINLKSLQSYVDAAKRNGAEDYNPPETLIEQGSPTMELKVDAYANPSVYDQPDLLIAPPEESYSPSTSQQPKLNLKTIKGSFGFGASLQPQLPAIATPKSIIEEDDDEYEDIEVWVTDEEAELEEEVEDEKANEASSLFLGLVDTAAPKKKKEKKMKKIIQRVRKGTVNKPASPEVKPKIRIGGVKGSFKAPVKPAAKPTTKPKLDLFAENNNTQPATKTVKKVVKKVKPSPKQPTATGQKPQKTPTPKSQSTDLLGDDIFGSTPAPAPAPAAPQANNGDVDLFGSLDFGGSVAPSNAPSTVLDDPFSDVNLSPTNMQQQIKKNEDPFAVLGLSTKVPEFDPNNLKVPSIFLGRYNNAPKIPAVPFVQENNNTLAICSQVIYAEKFTTYALYIYNKSKNDLKNVLVNVSTPRGLVLNVTTDPKALLQLPRVQFDTIKPGQYVYLSIDYSFQSPSLDTILMITVQCQGVNKQITYEIPPNDLLRAERLSPQELRMQISQNTCIKMGQSRSRSINTPHDFVNVLKSKMNIFPAEIQMATGEAYCFAKVAGTPFKCIIIGKVFKGQGVQIAVRSRDNTFCEYVLKQVTKLMV